MAVRCGFRNIGDMLVHEIAEGLKKAGKSQRDLAAALGLDASAVNRIIKGTRQIKAGEMDIIRKFLAAEAAPPAEPIREVAPAKSPVPDWRDMPRDIPVMGVAAGTLDGNGGAEFYLNGDISDYLRRPPGLAGAKHAFAVWTVSTSMVPWSQPGDPLFVNPSQPVRNGDHVIVELHGDDDHTPGPGFVKLLVRRAGSKLVLGQYNPPREDIEIPMARVKNLYRVIPIAELVGF